MRSTCCLKCGRPLVVKDKGRPRKYCSSTCRSSTELRQQVEYTCLECGMIFEDRKRKREVKYYSSHCAYMHKTFGNDRKTKKECQICKKVFYVLPGSSNPNMYCSKRCQLISICKKSYYFTEGAFAQILKSLNVKFEEQFSYAQYFADFYLPDYLLLIELDGRTWHSSDMALKRDKLKGQVANKLGFNMIRIWCSRRKEVLGLEECTKFLAGDDLAGFISAIPEGMINSVNLLQGVVVDATANGENQTTGNAVPSLGRNAYEGVETKGEPKDTEDIKGNKLLK